MSRHIGSEPSPVTIETRDHTGGIATGVTVSVSATVYSDAAFTTPLTPVVTDGTGRVSFYCAPGNYTFTVPAGIAPIQAISVGGQTGPDLSGFADGQVPVWSASLGRFTGAAPAGAAEGGRVTNTTATVTGPVSGGNSATGTAIAVPSTSLQVPASNGRPVYLCAHAFGQQTTTGDGVAYLEFWETTGAATLLYRGSGKRLPNSTAATVKAFDIDNWYRLGVVASQRTFEVRINCFGIATTPAWQAANGTDVSGLMTAHWYEVR